MGDSAGKCAAASADMRDHCQCQWHRPLKGIVALPLALLTSFNCQLTATQSQLLKIPSVGVVKCYCCSDRVCIAETIANDFIHGCSGNTTTMATDGVPLSTKKTLCGWAVSCALVAS